MRKASFGPILLTVAIFLAGALPGAAAPRYTCLDLGAQGIAFTYTYVYAINASGQAAGYARTNQGDRAWLYHGGGMEVLGTLPDPYNASSVAYGVNAAGQVAGCSQGSTGYSHAFLYSGGALQDLKTFPNGTLSFAYGINATGQVVGESNGSSASFYAFRYSNGVMQNLGTLPGKSSSKAYGINDTGQVVGESGWYAFLYSGGSMQNLGTLPGGDNSRATAINATGQVVGSCGFSNPIYYHAFLYTPGVGMQDLGTLPAPYNHSSYAYGINAALQAVGSSYDTSSHSHAFIYSSGVMQDLNGLVPNLPASVTFTEARGINDRGQIVVNGTDTSSLWHDHAYLLTPIQSSPAALDLLLLQ